MPIFNYPEPPTEEISDSYYSTSVVDPYRSLEEDSHARRDWLAAQEELTERYYDEIHCLDSVEKRVKTLRDYERIYRPHRAGQYLYFFRNTGLEDQASLCRCLVEEDPAEESSVVLDPSRFGDEAAISRFAVSKAGRYLACTVSRDGSDWETLHVFNTSTKEEVIDPIENVKFSGLSWCGDTTVLFSKYDESSSHFDTTEQHLLHGLDIASGETNVLFGKSEEYRFVNGVVSEDDEFLVVTPAQTTHGTKVYARRLDEDEFTVLVEEEDEEFSFLAHDNGHLLFETTYEAPNTRVVSIPYDNADESNWDTVIDDDGKPKTVSTAGGYLFVRYIDAEGHTVSQYRFDGSHVKDVVLPGDGYVSGFSEREATKTTYFTFSNHTTPPSLYEYSIDDSENPEKLFQSNVAWDYKDYVSTQLTCRSADGTEIPMTMTHRSDWDQDDPKPLLLRGYGGFGVTSPPYYDTLKAAWLESGGVFVEPSLRGGGLRGEDWHEAGMKQSKQNTFDDFIATAEYLIDEGYATTDSLAITGASNGGLLVGAVLTQRPDLFGVALPRAGVFDMLRYEHATVGAAWSVEYGSPDDSQDMFEYLLSYSPVHNVENEDYPAVRLYTAENDDRVAPWHTYKFTAALQEHSNGDAPIILETHETSGHGAFRSTQKQVEEQAHRLAFAVSIIDGLDT
mgnify:CR=1 FL=1